MSAPPISPWRSLRAVYRLVLRHQVSVGRLAVGIVLGVLALLIAGALRVGADESIDPLRDATRFIDGFGLSIVVPVLALVYASSALGDMVDDRTLAYVWLTPTPRVVIAAGAALAAATVALPATLPVLVLAAALSNGQPALVGGTAVAVTVGVVGYAGLFCWLGLRFRRALVWGVAYILLWEGFVVRASDSAARLSLRTYTRSILSEYTGVGLEQATMPMWVGVAVPLAVALAAVVLVGRRLAHTHVD